MLYNSQNWHGLLAGVFRRHGHRTDEPRLIARFSDLLDEIHDEGSPLFD
jgi:hypothetical protein